MGGVRNALWVTAQDRNTMERADPPNNKLVVFGNKSKRSSKARFSKRALTAEPSANAARVPVPAMKAYSKSATRTTCPRDAPKVRNNAASFVREAKDASKLDNSNRIPDDNPKNPNARTTRPNR